MSNDPHNLPEPYAFLYATERFYAGLTMHAMKAGEDGCSPTLGGQLLYAGELNDAARGLVVAANVVGAATLCATGDVAAQRMANRDGIVDFVVTSLDEALRILKNEIRKQETVAVCVGIGPEALEAEMRERGVQPDLVGHFPLMREKAAPDDLVDENLSMGPPVPEHWGAPRSVEQVDAGGDEALLLWQVADTPARWMPRLDALAMETLGPEDECARRWLRLHGRFCGRIARGIHLLRCSAEAARTFVARVEVESLRVEIGVPVEVRVSYRGMVERHRFTPGTPEKQPRS